MALVALEGISTRMFQQAREGSIRGQLSTLSVHEMGMHAPINTTHNKSAPYLVARQWLEHDAATHAEQSPMGDNSYLPFGRTVLYD